jgi:hypothetical protein
MYTNTYNFKIAHCITLLKKDSPCENVPLTKPYKKYLNIIHTSKTSRPQLATLHTLKLQTIFKAQHSEFEAAAAMCLSNSYFEIMRSLVAPTPCTVKHNSMIKKCHNFPIDQFMIYNLM